MYGTCSLAKIAQKVGRPTASVNKMVAKLFPESVENNNMPWSAKEVARLKNLYGSGGAVEHWSRIFKRSVTDIERKIISLKADVAEQPWNRESLATLKRLYGSRSNYDLSLILGMPVRQIEDKANELCLAKCKRFSSSSAEPGARTKMPRWMPEDIETLKRLHPTKSNEEIARHLGRTTKAVTSKANALGLKKSSDHLKKMGQDNVEWRYHCEKREEELNEKTSDSDA
jgi:hypothetical protein